MSTPWIELIKTNSMLDAQIIAGRLEAEGIPARILPSEAGHRLGITVGKLGEIKIEVPETHLKEAKVVIETDYSEESEMGEWDDEDWDEEDEEDEET